MDGHCNRCEKNDPASAWTEHGHGSTEGVLCCTHYEAWVREHFQLPKLILDGLQRWVDDGIMPGGFLEAVLRDAPLSIVCGRADDDNGRVLQKLVWHLRNKVPPECWGSESRVRAWGAAVRTRHSANVAYAPEETR